MRCYHNNVVSRCYAGMAARPVDATRLCPAPPPTTQSTNFCLSRMDAAMAKQLLFDPGYVDSNSSMPSHMYGGMRPVSHIPIMQELLRDCLKANKFEQTYPSI